MRRFFSWLLTVQGHNDDARRRGYISALISLGMIVTVIGLLPLSARPFASPITLPILSTALLGFLITFLLARNGYGQASALIIIGLILCAILGVTLFDRTVSLSLFFLSLSVLIASLTLPPRYIWLVLIANLISLGVVLSSLPRAIWQDNATVNIAITGAIFLGIITVIAYLGAAGMRGAMDKLQEAYLRIAASTAALEQNNISLEAEVAERTTALQMALAEVQARVAEQARLLEENEQQRLFIREMSVPVIPVSDAVAVVPLIGELDSARLEQFHRQALQAIEQTGIHYLVLDITGVVIVDTFVAQGFMAVVQSAQLLGTQVLLVGIRPEVAQTMVQLGVQLEGVRTFNTLQIALSHVNLSASAKARKLPSLTR